ncbi:MAG: hypothetical protein ACRD63_17515, partial [Pyrinomonadaceae bacterium]
VIGRIKEKLSFATEDEKYIFTENVMNIDDVLKDGPVHIVTDSEITITVPGGTIQLDGRRFRAIDRSFKPFEVGDHYLLLLKFVAETGDYKPVNSRSSFLIRDNKAEELTEEQMQGFINGRDAASLINELRAVAQVNNCKNGKGE